MSFEYYDYGWISEEPDPEHQPQVFIPEIPDAVKEADREMDAILKWTAAGMATALLAGYGVKKIVQKRRGNK